jgi:REP element-mobilizing transposase RayT
VEVTCRTLQGRLLLCPSAELNAIVIGILGRASRLYPVRLVAFAFLSNHYHFLLEVDDALQLASFMGYVNSNLAREAGRLADWREKFWSRRYEAILVSEEERAQVERLKYLLSQGCKEGLVARPRRSRGSGAARRGDAGGPLVRSDPRVRGPAPRSSLRAPPVRHAGKAGARAASGLEALAAGDLSAARCGAGD